MLNVDTGDGLTNGATCTLQSFQLPHGPLPKGCLWVKFDDPDVGENRRQIFREKGLYADGIHDTWTPILPESRKFSGYRNNEITRIQFPLRAASAKTIHRVQGSTLLEVVIDFKGRCQAGMHYVALSRPRSLENLFLLNFDPNKIKVSVDVQKEMARLRNIPYPWSLKFPSELPAMFRIIFLNARSMHLHKHDVTHSHDLMCGHMLLVAETRFMRRDREDTWNIDGYRCHRFDQPSQSGRRPHLGMAAYLNENDADYRNLENHDINGVHMIKCTVHLKNGLVFNVITVYKQQNVSITNLIEALREVVKEEIPVIILGDFNFDTNKAPDIFKAFLYQYDLVQEIHQPTNDYRRCIDNIYTNLPTRRVCGVSQTYFSDHKSVWINLQEMT